MKRIVAALVVGGVVFGGALAMAASLGGIDAGNFGADTDIVASCDTDGVTVDWVADYEDSLGTMVVGAFGLEGLSPACVGQNYRIVLANAAGDELWNGTGLITESDYSAANGQRFYFDPFPADDIPVSQVAHVHVAIYTND